MDINEAIAQSHEEARRRRRAGAFVQAMLARGFEFVGEKDGTNPRDPDVWRSIVQPTAGTGRATNEERRLVVTREVNGLATMVKNADEGDEQAWAEIARRAGAIQRRSRLLAGLGRGG